MESLDLAKLWAKIVLANSTVVSRNHPRVDKLIRCTTDVFFRFTPLYKTFFSYLQLISKKLPFRVPIGFIK
jgi:hypothetical protein